MHVNRRSLLLTAALPLLGACAHTAPAANFTPDYQAANRGHIQILVPETYELISIAMALTPFAGENSGLIATNNDYYPRVLEHFGAFRSHPLISALDARMRVEPPLSAARLRMNSYAFEFDAHDRIVPSRIYTRVSYEEDKINTIAPLIAEAQSFADQSGFRAFYAANRSVYDSQISFFRDSADVEGMWRWLRERFPRVRPYDGVKIIFSPLVGNIQTLTTFESNGYRELQPHVNFPYNINPAYSSAGIGIWRSTTLFGELNHGFNNPTSEPFRAEIDAAIRNRADWTTEANATAYPDDQAVFDEYMNFGLITLYHRDRLNDADFALAHARIDRVMAEDRGFRRFVSFNAFLLDLYLRRRPDQTIADLYPAIIAWFAAQ